MLKRTRVGTTLDVRRLGEAVSFPGIDPRINQSLAFALDEQKVDAKFGPMVDVVLLPSQLVTTCRVAGEYAGNGFGLYAGKIHKDDQLLVEFPNGDPAEGGVVVKRFWNGADPPPALAASNEGDTAWVFEGKTTFRLVTSGTGGKVYLQSDDTVTFTAPKVRLGDENATEAVLLGDTYSTNEGNFLTAASTFCTNVQTAAAQLQSGGALMVTPVYGAVAASPLVTAAGAALVAACTAFSTAIQTFANTTAQNKSTVTKTK